MRPIIILLGIALFSMVMRNCESLSPEDQVRKVIQGFGDELVNGDNQKMMDYLSKEARRNSGMALGFVTEYRPESVSISSMSIANDTAIVSFDIEGSETSLWRSRG